MRAALVFISSLLLTAAVLPYTIDIVRRRTKPRVVSWFTWSLLSGIAAAASFSDHQWPAGILSLLGCLGCVTIVLLGFRYGEKHFTPFDVSCQAAAIIGLILWWLFNSPSVAIVASILIDLIASLPTFQHSYLKPAEETWPTFFLAALGSTFTLLAAKHLKITSVAMPIYLAVWNYAVAFLIIWRRRVLQPVDPL